ncbi:MULTISPECIES: flagellin lysine-N-methylase [unclassified Sporolactobacillus]|uniref:flagellin lysine-N-methylase n=1 Tax=unclassified Sporolactobacillus TaxID=2628533 RepID=UPI002368BD25|nr:flagellin lysine-N-methylase [Sporolactobacillus sp. CQH2019]MDD9149659.1 flagellin lysine-N-methylase [Sporolactobacillus sp. CQH2019]
MKKALQPDYVSKFTCIASDCEDTCCRGWRITIDDESYGKYQELSRRDDLFSGKITRDGIMSVEGDFAEVILSENTCPFLNDKKLCRIQEAYGERYLSVTCGIFPRNYNLVNGKLELSLDLSCPHAARLALLDPLPMQLSLSDIKKDSRISKIPTIKSSDTDYPNQVYPYFEEGRAFVLALLQNRNYCFEDRLVILGRFCNDLNLKHDRPKDEMIQLIYEYTRLVTNFGFNQFIDSIPKQPASMLKTLMILLEYRLKTGVPGQRFSECIDQCKQGLHFTMEMSDHVLHETFATIKTGCYDPFMAQHEYIFENYFVNYCFKTLFPFGKQKSIYKKDIFVVPETMFTEYMLLTLHYALIKNLLVGMAGYYRDQFGTQQVLTLIQSFDKNIGHDAAYLQRLLQFFDENKIFNVACAAMLIKN